MSEVCPSRPPQRRPLGRSDLVVSPVGFGCYRIHPQNPLHAQALARALQAGINLVDTAANYGAGASEVLVGRVLAQLGKEGRLRRDRLVVVSKAGYLQGPDLEACRRRPWPELVPYRPQLQHCIHPDFLAWQLERSLRRLDLDYLDAYLLHNPEYYLAWAEEEGRDRHESEPEYYRRLGVAFAFLEEQVRAGRIRYYGLSCNTLAAPAGHPQATSLARLWELAAGLGPEHHFRVVQLPLNLLEPAAALDGHGLGGLSPLEWARERGLGVLGNRPLNAMAGGRLVRLAPVASGEAPPRPRLLEILMELRDSESQLQEKLLPNLGLEEAEQAELAGLLSVAPTLLQQWERLPGVEYWYGLEEIVVARVNQAFMRLARRLAHSREGLSALDDHLGRLKASLQAVGAFQARASAGRCQRIYQWAAGLDPDWGRARTLSRLALRAVRSTAGMGCVLVGMRRPEYVEDVLAELARPVKEGRRRRSWTRAAKEAGLLLEEES